jgi:hypothetical protein
MSVSKQDLEQALEGIFKQLKAKNPGFSTPDPKHLISLVADNILKNHKNLSLQDLLDPNFTKVLQVALIAEQTNRSDPTFKFDYAKFLDKDNLFDPKLQQELKHLLEHMLKRQNAAKPPQERLSENEINKLAQTLLNTLKMRLQPQAGAKKSEQALMMVNILADALIHKLQMDNLRSLYGGINPNVTGGIVAIVQVVTGNLFAIPDQNGDNANSMAFIDELTRTDGKPDPNGIENINRQNSLGLGNPFADDQGPKVDKSPEGYESPSPFKTKPKAPGTV